ncbi:MAG: GyrI-like domain-containing protein [Thermoleophilia bacterium]|nr:GyrI-like domain-containing protein [Thermoleophilia bacterium]
MDYEISEMELAPQLALTHRVLVTMPTIAEKIGAGFGVLMEHAAKTGVQWAGPPFILYPEDCDDAFEIVICMPVVPGAAGGQGVELEEIPGGRVATTTHVGPYREVGKAYTAMQKWMTDNGCRPAGKAREIYLNDPGEVPESELLTEVDWPIA